MAKCSPGGRGGDQEVMTSLLGLTTLMSQKSKVPPLIPARLLYESKTTYWPVASHWIASAKRVASVTMLEAVVV